MQNVRDLLGTSNIVLTCEGLEAVPLQYLTIALKRPSGAARTLHNMPFPSCCNTEHDSLSFTHGPCSLCDPNLLSGSWETQEWGLEAACYTHTYTPLCVHTHVCAYLCINISHAEWKKMRNYAILAVVCTHLILASLAGCSHWEPLAFFLASLKHVHLPPLRRARWDMSHLQRAEQILWCVVPCLYSYFYSFQSSRFWLRPLGGSIILSILVQKRGPL